jgi:hypothetical protein
LGKTVCHTKCFTLLAFFNDILWAQAYNNNILLLAAIRYKKTMNTAMESQKEKKSHFKGLSNKNTPES